MRPAGLGVLARKKFHPTVSQKEGKDGAPGKRIFQQPLKPALSIKRPL